MSNPKKPPPDNQLHPQQLTISLAVTVGSQFDEHPKAIYTNLDYLDQGISFEFIDGRIAVVRVYLPTTKYERTLWDHDIGDTSKYRDIVPNRNADKKGK